MQPYERQAPREFYIHILAISVVRHTTHVNSSPLDKINPISQTMPSYAFL